eukprot:1995481-Amphidinium_carterae.1
MCIGRFCGPARSGSELRAEGHALLQAGRNQGEQGKLRIMLGGPPHPILWPEEMEGWTSGGTNCRPHPQVLPLCERLRRLAHSRASAADEHRPNPKRES